MHSYYIDRLRVFSAFSVVLIHVVYQSVLYCNGGVHTTVQPFVLWSSMLFNDYRKIAIR